MYILEAQIKDWSGTTTIRSVVAFRTYGEADKAKDALNETYFWFPVKLKKNEQSYYSGIKNRKRLSILKSQIGSLAC